MDTSNIIPRSRRRAAIASGLARAPEPASTSTNRKNHTIAIDSDDEEAEF